MNPKALYGLIGRPLGHSFSRDFFTKKFQTEDINAEYLNFELPDIGDVMELIVEYKELRGFNVTIPYKQQIIPYLDEIDDEARGVGAVNVVKIYRDYEGRSSLKGFNSDVYGFTESLRPLLKPCHKGALVLGTGGASKAVVYALTRLGIKVTRVSRKTGDGVITYNDLTPEVIKYNRLIVNTTPLGMYPNIEQCPDIPYDLLNSDNLCFDLVYNPAETMFMREAKQRGVTVKNGLEMLHLQAIEAWRIWNIVD